MIENRHRLNLICSVIFEKTQWVKPARAAGLMRMCNRWSLRINSTIDSSPCFFYDPELRPHGGPGTSTATVVERLHYRKTHSLLYIRKYFLEWITNRIHRIERWSFTSRGIESSSSLGYRQDSVGLEIAETTLCWRNPGSILVWFYLGWRSKKSSSESNRLRSGTRLFRHWIHRETTLLTPISLMRQKLSR